MQGKLPVGILGGGQLGCMLADAALALGLSPFILAPLDSPAAAIFPDRLIPWAASNAPEDDRALADLFARAKDIAFENEFLDCDQLERVASRAVPERGVRFHPPLRAIRELQDKLRQKEILVDLGIPTAPFRRIEPGADTGMAVEGALAAYEGNAVFKWSRLGYDGKGVRLASDTPEGRDAATAFCRESLARDVPAYAEQKVDFRRELAIIACRSEAGEFDAYPLVVSEQENGICKRVLGPATALGVPARIEREARTHAQRLAEAMGLTGVFALELFETVEGELLVNEIAPRVHNSGHYTQDACRTSQFENHWRAILGPALGLCMGNTVPIGAFGMLNLLGPDSLDIEMPRSRSALPFASPGAPLRLHWYGKASVRPRRKVGHVNGVAPSAGHLPVIERELARYEAIWRASLKELPPSPHRPASKG